MRPTHFAVTALVSAVFLAGGPALAADPQPRIEGKVFRSDNNKPFAGTRVRLSEKGAKDPKRETVTDNRGHFVFDGIAVGRTYLISTSIKFDSADSVPCQKAVSGVGSPLSLARNPDRWPVAVRVENDGKFLEVVVSDEFEVTSRGALQKNVDLYCK